MKNIIHKSFAVFLAVLTICLTVTFLGYAVCDHSYITVTKKATCGLNGYVRSECKKCGDIVSEEIIYATGHEYGDWLIIEEATHTKSGSKQRTCIKCKSVEYSTIKSNSMAHSIVTEVEKKSTCTEKGVVKNYCTQCSYSYTVSIKSTGHVLEDFTANEDGSRTGVCVVCEKTVTVNDDGKEVEKKVTNNKSIAEKIDEFRIWLGTFKTWVTDMIKNGKQLIRMIKSR